MSLLIVLIYTYTKWFCRRCTKKSGADCGYCSYYTVDVDFRHWHKCLKRASVFFLAAKRHEGETLLIKTVCALMCRLQNDCAAVVTVVCLLCNVIGPQFLNWTTLNTGVTDYQSRWEDYTKFGFFDRQLQIFIWDYVWHFSCVLKILILPLSFPKLGIWSFKFCVFGWKFC